MSLRKQKPKRNNKSHKNNNNKRRIYKESIVTVPRVSGFPDQTRVRLCYVEKVIRNPGVHDDNYTFRGNSLYDPNYTGGGHQPRYYDQYAAVYTKYKVLGSSIRVDFINTTQTAGASFALSPDTNPITYLSLGNIAELPRSKMTKFLPVATRNPVSIRHSISTQVALGLRPYQINDEDYSGSLANPSSLWYWNIYGDSSDSSTNLTYQMTVTIVYDAVFYDRTEIGDSFLHLTDDPYSRDHKKEKETVPPKREPQDTVYTVVKVLI